MFRLRNYIANRKLTNDEIIEINSTLTKFVNGWVAHKNKLNAGFIIFDSQIIQLYIDQDYEMASGCSLDKATKTIEEIEQNFNLDLFNRMRTAIIEGENIHKIVHFGELAKLKDQLPPNLKVFEHWTEYCYDTISPLTKK